MWLPALYTGNSGSLARSSTGERVGGMHWYMPSEAHGHHIPLSRVSDLLGSLEALLGGGDPPWLMATGNGKVFVGEYLTLAARLNADGKAHPHAFNGGRNTPYAYGFVGELGKVRIPSYAEMRAMNEAWREELSHLVMELNHDVAESFTNPHHLRGKAKSLEALVPEGITIGAHYSDNLWDQRAQRVNAGKALERPLLVNVKELTPGKDWGKLAHLVEVEGVEALDAIKKKNSTPAPARVPRPIGSKASAGELTKSLSRRATSLGSGGQGLAIALVTSLAIGSVIGIWVFNHRHKSQENLPTSNRDAEAILR